MQSENSPENTLKQLNECYRILDEIFDKLTNNDLDEDHFKYTQSHLDESIRLLNWINTYIPLTGEGNE